MLVYSYSNTHHIEDVVFHPHQTISKYQVVSSPSVKKKKKKKDYYFDSTSTHSRHI